MTEKSEKTTAKKEPVLPVKKFTKAQLIASKKYAADADILAAMLRNGRKYSAAEADKVIDDFKKRKVN